jgi:tRNA (guanine37-N1)-methyltransferase
MTPDGVPYKQEIAVDLSNEKHLIFVCGHYEGFDERIRTLCDMELSIGDYVLTGGELPAMVVSDSIIRLLDGVITGTSLDSESFNDKLLDYPTYTKPQEFMGMKVPDVLLSGDHAKIKAWRDEMRIKRTKERRPDLID